MNVNAEEKKEKRDETELCRRISRNIMQSFDSAAEKRYFLVPRSRVRMLVDGSFRDRAPIHFSHVSAEAAV